MTITKAGENGLLIVFSDKSDELAAQRDETDFSKIRGMVRSVISMLGLSWPDFGLELYSFGAKLLVFVIREKKKHIDIFAFHNIDDILDASAFIPDLPDASLYLLNGTYYLIADTTGASLTALLEFSFYDEHQPSDSHIKEHGKKILDASSIKRLSATFAQKNQS